MYKYYVKWSVYARSWYCSLLKDELYMWVSYFRTYDDAMRFCKRHQRIASQFNNPFAQYANCDGNHAYPECWDAQCWRNEAQLCLYTVP